MSEFNPNTTYGIKAMGGTKEQAIIDAEKALPEGTPYLLIEGAGFWTWFYHRDLTNSLKYAVSMQACKT